MFEAEFYLFNANDKSYMLAGAVQILLAISYNYVYIMR